MNNSDNGNQSAGVLPVEFCGEGVNCMGLTKREAFAMAAIQGILASKYYGEFGDKGNKTGNDVIAGSVAIAVLHADALLKELAK